MAVVQYTYTHKQHTERHKTNNIWNNTKILEECGPYPVFAGNTLEFALQLGKKQGKTLSQGSRRVPAGTMKIYKHTIRNGHNNKNNRTCIFFRRIFPKTLQYQISWKSVQWEPSCSMWARRRDTARTLSNFCVVLCIVCFVSFSVLFVCICVLYYCHRLATQLQLTNISYHKESCWYNQECRQQ